MNDADLTVSLLTLGDPNQLTGGYLYHVRMAERAASHGARLGFVPFPSRMFPFPALASHRIVTAATARHPDVFLVDSIAAAFAAPLLAIRRPAIPLVGMIHQPPGGIDHGWVRSRLQAPLDRLAYLHMEHLIVASEMLAGDLTAMGFPPHHVQVIPPGRDGVPAVVGSPGDLREGRRAALLCVGSWVPRKGILELVEAVSRMPADAATVHLVGDNDADPRYRRSVLARLEARELSRRFRIHGPLPPEHVSALFQAADVFVLPAVREPYGTVYAEAMAAGLPVVGWDAGNLPHLAGNDREGVIVPEGDVEALGDALTRLAEDDDERRRMGEAAKRRAAGLPTWDDSAAAFFQSLRDIAGRRTAA